MCFAQPAASHCSEIFCLEDASNKVNIRVLLLVPRSFLNIVAKPPSTNSPGDSFGV
jgi:hypothetical protein